MKDPKNNPIQENILIISAGKQKFTYFELFSDKISTYKQNFTNVMF